MKLLRAAAQRRQRRALLAAIAAAVRAVAFGAVAIAAAAQAGAADFPERPVRFVVPFGPGGATDLAARVIADSMGRALGQPVIVENKAGGNGVIAMQSVVSARPDGYTLLVGNVTTNTINPLLKGAAMPFNVRTEFALIGQLVEVPAMLIATRKDFPPNTLAELVDHARKHPGKLFYNSAGVLSYSHLDMLELQRRAGIRLDMVPVSAGGGSGQTDIISGDVQLALRNVASAASFVKTGQIKALAVTTENRLAQFPDVPTMKEQGYGGVGTNAWQALFAPRKTPDAVLTRLNDALRSALRDPATQKRLDELQIVVAAPLDLAQSQKWLDAEFLRWTAITDEARRLPDGKP